jgi:hypothetical protein
MKKRRLWLLGLLVLTALTILLWGKTILISPPLLALETGALESRETLEIGAIAPSQNLAQSPASDATPDATPDPPVNPQDLPAVIIPSTPPASEDMISPSPALQDLQQALEVQAALPLDGQFIDAQGQYQVGILPGYRVTTIGNSPLMEAADGQLAYTVVTVPRAPNAFDRPLTDTALAQVAQGVFQRGEAFQPQPYRSVPSGIQISWTGQLTLGGVAQPVGGELLALQAEKGITVLLVAATAGAAEQVPIAFATVVNSLQFL